MYRPCVNRDDVRDWKEVVALNPDDGFVGDYSDGYGNYQYTCLGFTVESVPVIPEGLTFTDNQLLFVTSGSELRCKTQEELSA
jgi:hypothetical protein